MGCGASGHTDSARTGEAGQGHVNSVTSNSRPNPARPTHSNSYRDTPFIGTDGRPLTRKIERPVAYRHTKSITQSELQRIREEFWHTRVEGDSTMWQSLRSAADAVLHEDIDLANAILEAGIISTPNASLDLCYDERGFAYNVPAYCYANPTNISISNNSNGNGNKGSSTPKIPEQGSMRSSGQSLKVKVRINPGDLNVVLDVSNNSTVADLKKQIYAYSSESNGKMVVCEEGLQRVMFMGKELHNNTTIKQAGIDDIRIVQIFVRPKKQ